MWALRRFTTVFGTGTGGPTAHYCTRTKSDTDKKDKSEKPHGAEKHMGTARSCPAGAGQRRHAAMTREWEEERHEERLSPQATRPMEDESAAPITRCPPLASYPSGLLGALPAPGWGMGHLGVSFALRCVQRFSGPDVATRRCSWRNSLRTSGPSAPVLSY